LGKRKGCGPGFHRERKRRTQFAPPKGGGHVEFCRRLIPRGETGSIRVVERKTGEKEGRGACKKKMGFYPSKKKSCWGKVLQGYAVEEVLLIGGASKKEKKGGEEGRI